MNKKIVLTILLFLFGCQGWPSQSRLAQFKDSPASTLIFSNEAFHNATGESPWYMYWASKDYLSVTGIGIGIEKPSSILALKIPELSIVSRPEDSYTDKISPDGKYFISFPKGDSWGVSSLSDLLESGKDTLVYSFPKDEYRGGEFDWSRDSQNLALISIDSPKNSIALRIYDLPGHTIRTIFEYVEKIKDVRMELQLDNLSWSADGKRLAFSVQYVTDVDENHRNYQHDLFIYNIEKNKLVKVTSTPDLNEFYPSWHPESNILMFVMENRLSEPFSEKLAFLSNDGECIRTLPGYEGISFPSWSPTGNQIAYISTDGIEILDVEKIIPPEYLSPDTLCQISDGPGE